MAEQDFASEATPERALRAVLQRHPAFTDEGVQYPYGKPDFLTVDVREIADFDWEALPEKDHSERPEDGPVVTIRSIHHGQMPVSSVFALSSKTSGLMSHE